MIVPEADVVIMGGGLAGLVAGNRALELGLSAIILEQGATDDYLCDSRISTGAIHLAGTSPKADPDLIVSRITELTSGFTNTALASALAGTASEAIDWLEDHGAEFLRGTPTPRYWLAPSRGRQKGLSWQGWGSDRTIAGLIRQFREKGGQLVLGAQGRELLFEQADCAGIEAIAPDGMIQYRAPAVLLADGGFHGSSELIGRFISPKPESIKKRNAGAALGTSLLMAERAGAWLVGMQYFYGHLLSRDALTNDALWPYPTLDLLASASIVVHSRGERFADEGIGGIYLANRIAWADDPLDFWLVFDDETWNSDLAIRLADPAHPDSPNPDLVDLGGTLERAGSLEELAQRIGAPVASLAETIGAFNEAIERKSLELLRPARRAGATAPRPIRTPPFYAVPLCAGITLTMGGPAVDEHCRVLREDGSVIPGLFVIGSALGGLEGGDTVGYWGGLSQALISGLRAADFVAGKIGHHPLPGAASGPAD